MQAVRAKRDSSIRVGLRLVRDKRRPRASSRQATLAPRWPRRRWCWAQSQAWIGRRWRRSFPPRSRGQRPACLTSAPMSTASRTKSGAIRGDGRNLLSHHVWNPGVRESGLLSIGEEESKGNDLTKEAMQLVEAASAEFRRQRGRPRPVQRRSGRDCRRRVSWGTWR